MNINDNIIEIIPPVSIKKFIELLPILYRIKDVATLVISNAGLGKTQSVEKFCNKNNLEYINIRLAYIESQDIIGFPKIVKGRMVYIQPDFLPCNIYSKGILFFDDINRARPDVLQSVFHLILERELGVGDEPGKNYKLPDNWMIISAMNPDTEQYYVTPMDAALLNRFLIIPIEFNSGDYMEYIKDNTDVYDSRLRDFILKKNVIISDPKIKNIEISPTPRSFELFNKILKKIYPGEFSYLDVIGNGLIGRTNYNNFITSLIDNSEEIIILLNNILRGEYFECSEKIHNLEENYLNRVIGALDRFIILKIKNNYEFENLINWNTANIKEIKYFLDFLFNLTNENIVSTLYGIYNIFNNRNKIPKYQSIFSNYLEQNDKNKKKYETIITENSELNIYQYI